MNADICGSETERGWPCRYPAKGCPHHDRSCGSGDEAPDLPTRGKRDARELGWRLVERVALGTLGVRQATSMMRLVMQVHRLGPEPEDEELKQRRWVLIGQVMNGLPPRTEEEWALAEETFDEAAMREIKRWPGWGPTAKFRVEGSGSRLQEPPPEP